jgi:hypothetical protein
MKTFQARQGDVFIERIEAKEPEGEEIPKDNGRVVLAYGEVTGHAHAIKSDGARLFFLDKNKGLRRLVVKRATALKHEEHGPISLPAGDYAVIQQREYTPEEIRNVAD